jgi:hypothetical protein
VPSGGGSVTWEDLADRFWGRVKKGKGCWLWQGYKDKKTNYGFVNARRLLGAPTTAQRVAWMLTNGPITDGLHVLHKCDNPPCVRPSHLFLGTQQDNNEDRDRKGRVARGDRNGSRTRPDRRAVGERCGSSRMTEKRVRRLRRAYATGRWNQRQLAARYGISQQQVSTITSRKHWKHIG